MLFAECTSLESIPNISQIKFPDDFITSYMFYGCNTKFDIPDKFKKNY